MSSTAVSTILCLAAYALALGVTAFYLRDVGSLISSPLRRLMSGIRAFLALALVGHGLHLWRDLEWIASGSSAVPGGLLIGGSAFLVVAAVFYARFLSAHARHIEIATREMTLISTGSHRA